MLLEHANWGVAPWRLEAVVPWVQVPQRCDVAVIGAGFTGLAAAYGLATRGVGRVAVLEAGRIGVGASGRTGGVALEGTAGGPLAEVESCLGTVERLLGETGIDCGLRLTGCWELEHAEADEPFLWSDGDAVLRVCGSVPGGTLEPGALLTGLARAVVDAGATIHEHVPVNRLDGGPPPRVHIGGSVLTAGHVVLATNAYISKLIDPPAGFDVALALALCTERLAPGALSAVGLGDGIPFYTIDLPYLWGRPLDDGRVVFGAGLLFHPIHHLEGLDVAAGTAAAGLQRLEERVRGLHRALGCVGIGARWAGPIAMVRGRPPLLGWDPLRPAVLVTGGYSGHGVALSLRVGELAAAAIAEGRALPAWGALPPPELACPE